MSKIAGDKNINNLQDTDSGFGSSFKNSNDRVLDKNGNFNIQRIGSHSISIFHELLLLSWSRMLLLILIFYILVNFIFALGFYCIGPHGISGVHDGSEFRIFWQCYFFSVQSFTTVGYGGMYPVDWKSSALAGFEALCGLLTFAIITGLVYSKFSRPNFKFLFSKNLLFAPYKDFQGAMFRVVNSNRQKLMDVEATMIFSYFPVNQNNRIFRTLDLEIKKISMFPLSWTINHPIVETSPIYSLNKEQMIQGRAEIIIIISAYDEESGRIVKNMNSYHYSDFVYNAKFLPMLEVIDGKTIIYLDKVSEFSTIN